MQKILGYLRRAVQDYNMLQNGDRIAVGISGGKDSLALLCGLHRLRSILDMDYEIVGVTIDPAFGGVPADLREISDLCSELGILYHVVDTHIGEIVFDIRNEKNPCSLCSRMRRGALYGACAEFHCNKLALGHNYDDTVETFLMNLFTEGRIGCYSPVTSLEDRDLTIIRPMIYAPEKEIRRAAKRNSLPVAKSPCPADGHTGRQDMKEFIAGMERQDHGFKQRIFGALQRSGIDGWKIKKGSP